MDLEKLSPAPWRIKMATDVIEGGTDPFTVAKCWSSTFAPTREVAAANATWIIMARNAFDVMMRRKWGIARVPDGWGVTSSDGVFPESQCVWGCFFGPDPFTALIEADAWYKKNVEKTGG